jgi:hypothetical protein
MPLVDGGVRQEDIGQGDAQEVGVERFIALVVVIPGLVGGIDLHLVPLLIVLGMVAAGVADEVVKVSQHVLSLRFNPERSDSDERVVGEWRWREPGWDTPGAAP